MGGGLAVKICSCLFLLDQLTLWAVMNNISTMLIKKVYSSVANKRTGPNKRTGWNSDKNQIIVQGGIKLLEYRVKTGNFNNNKKDF